MIDTDDLDNMSRLGFIPKRGLVELLEAYNESLAEVKRLREDNELYLACINTSQYKHEPGSAFRELGTVRQWQGRQREHVGALRCVYGKHPRDYLKEAEE